MSAARVIHTRREQEPCAAAAASHKMGFVGDRVTVHMHGGELLVEFARDGRIDMTGPVVYIGSITLAEQFLREKFYGRNFAVAFWQTVIKCQTLRSP